MAFLLLPSSPSLSLSLPLSSSLSRSLLSLWGAAIHHDVVLSRLCMNSTQDADVRFDRLGLDGTTRMASEGAILPFGALPRGAREGGTPAHKSPLMLAGIQLLTVQSGAILTRTAPFSSSFFLPLPLLDRSISGPTWSKTARGYIGQSRTFCKSTYLAS